MIANCRKEPAHYNIISRDFIIEIVYHLHSYYFLSELFRILRVIKNQIQKLRDEFWLYDPKLFKRCFQSQLA